GLTLEQYLDDSEEAESPEAFWADVEKRATDALTAQLVLDKYADEHEVGVEQNDLMQHVMRIAQQQGSDPQQELQHMIEHNHMPEYMAEIRRGKSLAEIVGAATVTDSNGDPVDLSELQPDGSLAAPAPEADADDEDAEGAEAVEGEAVEGEVETDTDGTGDAKA